MKLLSSIVPLLLFLSWIVGWAGHCDPDKNILFLALSLFAVSTRCSRNEKNN